MSLQSPRVFPVSFASGASLSAQIDTGGGYLYVSLEIPSNSNIFSNGSSGSPYWVQGADVSSGTFRRFSEGYTATVNNPFTVASAVCNTIIPIPYFNMRFIKVEISGTVSGGATAGVGYTIVCTDSL